MNVVNGVTFPGMRREIKEATGLDIMPAPTHEQIPHIPSLDKIADAIQRTYPELWRQCYTKHLDAPGNYRGFKAVATTLASAIIETNMYARAQKLVSNGGLIASMLQKYDFPCYFVTEPLLQAMLRTHPPAGSTWADINFPFDSLVFMIPRGLLKEPGGQAIYALGVGHIGPANLQADIPDWARKQGGHNYARAFVFWMMEPAGCGLHDCTFPLTQSLEPDPAWIDAATAQQVEAGNIPDALVSGDFASHMAGIAANLLLVMQARPELVERGGATRKRLGKSGAPIHTPTFIGRKYATEMRGPKPEASGHFTELRWVAGHMHKYWVGKGRTESVIRWIEPYIKYGAGLKREEADDR